MNHDTQTSLYLYGILHVLLYILSKYRFLMRCSRHAGSLQNSQYYFVKPIQNINMNRYEAYCVARCKSDMHQFTSVSWLLGSLARTTGLVPIPIAADTLDIMSSQAITMESDKTLAKKNIYCGNCNTCHYNNGYVTLATKIMNIQHLPLE